MNVSVRVITLTDSVEYIPRVLKRSACPCIKVNYLGLPAGSYFHFSTNVPDF